MPIEVGAFDRDMALFDASSALPFLTRTSAIGGCWHCLRSNCAEEVRSLFPRLWSTLKNELQECNDFELIFANPHLKCSEPYPDYTVHGPSTILIISSTNPGIFPPGSILRLAADDIMKLKFTDFKNHFVGISRRKP